MSNKNDFLDRMARLVPDLERPYERFHRRRERKRRNQRLRAGALGVGLTLAGILIASSAVRTQHETGHTSESPSPSQGSEIRHGSFAEAKGWIAYASGIEVIAVNPADPGQQVVLGSTHGGEFLSSGTDADPIGWSADGTRLLLRTAFEPYGARSHFGLYVFNADGTWTTLVNEFAQRAPAPTWGSFSPDGDQVVYGSTGAAPGPFIVDADGGSSRQILGPCEPPSDFAEAPITICGEPFDEAAAWSPHGAIAWSDFVEDSGTFGHHAHVLSFVNPDGTGLRQGVVEVPSSGLSLAWSPDGSRLAFWGSPNEMDKPTDIYVIEEDGSGLRQLTHGGDNRWPTWSPDGTRIAFVRDRILHTMAADGSDVRSLGVEVDGAIAWNPVR